MKAQTRRALGIVAVVASAWMTASAHATTTASLSAAFNPERLGTRTTLAFGFSFSAPAQLVPPPLVQMQLRYPANLGIGLSGLGSALCSAATLEARGPAGCPPNSVMGYGVVRTGIVLGTTSVTESAPITIFRARYEAGHLALLFYAQGTKPVSTAVIFSGLLLPAPLPFGGKVSIGVPLVPTLPGAPYISVIDLRATIGPNKVTYYERVGGFTFAYHPEGILLPRRCPQRGFPFTADFEFSDGSNAQASTKVLCRLRRGAASGRASVPAHVPTDRAPAHARRLRWAPAPRASTSPSASR